MVDNNTDVDDESEEALFENDDSDDSASSRLKCAICARSMPITRLEFICVHDLVALGLKSHPQPSTPVSGSAATHDTKQAFKLCRHPVKGLKRVHHRSLASHINQLIRISLLLSNAEMLWQ